MTPAEQLIDDVIGREGRYVNHPSDRGGPTMWGITAQVARAHGYQGDMRNLPRSTAVTIYRRRYWEEPLFSAVALIFPKVAVELLDTGVNMGPAIASGFLQRALNLLNRGGKAWPDIVQDGRIGSMTLDAARRYKASRGEQAETVLLRCLDGFQLARYAEITEARPANEDFFFGWVANRIGALA
jgi:lysozyme family protein